MRAVDRLYLFLFIVVAASALPPTVTLRNGVKMPMISAGVFQYNASTAEDSITAALDVGFTAVDTALDYWNQQGVGAAIKQFLSKGHMRDDIFVETKIPGCGNPSENTTRNPFKCYNDAKKNLQQDLDLLGLDFVDLVIVHFPPFPSFVARSCGELTGSCEMARAQWKAMVEFYKAGKAKAIGVSNYCPSCFECLKDSDVFPMLNQVMYHIGMGADPGGIISYGKSKGVVTQAYSALGNTPWTHHANPKILTGNETSTVAKAHNVSTVQVALKYLVSQGVPAVTKSGNPKHLASDLDLWSWDFTQNDITTLDAFKTQAWYEKYSFACNKFEEIPVIV